MINEEEKVFLYVKDWEYKQDEDKRKFKETPKVGSVVTAFKVKTPSEVIYKIPLIHTSNSDVGLGVAVIGNQDDNHRFKFELEEITADNIDDFPISQEDYRVMFENIEEDYEREEKPSPPIDETEDEISGVVEMDSQANQDAYEIILDDEVYDTSDVLQNIYNKDRRLFNMLKHLLNVSQDINIDNLLRVNGIDIDPYVKNDKNGVAYAMNVAVMSNAHANSPYGDVDALLQIIYHSIKELQKYR